MNSLNFLETISVGEMKSRQQSGFQICRKENGYWFRCGSVSGHVSDNLDPTTVRPDDVRISLVEGDSGQFWMCHKQGTADVAVEW